MSDFLMISQESPIMTRTPRRSRIDWTRLSRKVSRSGLGVVKISQKKWRPRMAEKRKAGMRFSWVMVAVEDLKSDRAWLCSVVDSVR